MKVYGLPEGQGLDHQNDMALTAARCINLHIEINDSKILLANDTEFCFFVHIFAAGTITWYRPGPYQMIVPTCASTEKQGPASDAFLTNEKTCYICDMH